METEILNPCSHIVYEEDYSNPEKPVKKLYERSSTYAMAKMRLGLILMNYVRSDARQNGDVLNLREQGRIIKRWVITGVENEEGLGLG